MESRLQHHTLGHRAVERAMDRAGAGRIVDHLRVQVLAAGGALEGGDDGDRNRRAAGDRRPVVHEEHLLREVQAVAVDHLGLDGAGQVDRDIGRGYALAQRQRVALNTDRHVKLLAIHGDHRVAGAPAEAGAGDAALHEAGAEQRHAHHGARQDAQPAPAPNSKHPHRSLPSTTQLQDVCGHVAKRRIPRPERCGAPSLSSETATAARLPRFAVVTPYTATPGSVAAIPDAYVSNRDTRALVTILHHSAGLAAAAKRGWAGGRMTVTPATASPSPHAPHRVP